MNHDVFTMESTEDIRLCFPAFKALRPHLEKDAFVTQVLRQQAQSYKVIAIKKGEVVSSVSV